MDELHRAIVQEALAHDIEVQEPYPGLLFGELVLFHTLLQDWGTELLERDQWLALMERNSNRIKNFQIERGGE